jgi:alpha-tubulin suppressor-like RCC1 family protein
MLGVSATAIAAGYGHTCAIATGGSRLLCWGYNSNGQLGIGSYLDAYSPLASSLDAGALAALSYLYTRTHAHTRAHALARALTPKATKA